MQHEDVREYQEKVRHHDIQNSLDHFLITSKQLVAPMVDGSLKWWMDVAVPKHLTTAGRSNLQKKDYLQGPVMMDEKGEHQANIAITAATEDHYLVFTMSGVRSPLRSTFHVAARSG